MKKYIFLIALSITIITSCKIDRYPEDKTLSDDINVSQLKFLLNGCYSEMKIWANQMHRVREYPADNVVIRGSSTDSFFPFISYQHVADNGRLSLLWNSSYKVIYQSSDIINLIEKTDNNNEHIYNLGEAYYLRGLCYFYLCNTWGRPYHQNPEVNLAVPIVNGFKIDKQNMSDLPDRHTVKKVYEQIISDLKKASYFMSLSEPKSSIYASKEVAQALLSRVYLYMGGTFEQPNNTYNDLAIKYSDSVINSGRYSLLSYSDFKIYNTLAPEDKTQKETIFAVKFKDSDYPTPRDYYGNIGGMYSNIKGLGWGEMYASAKYLNMIKLSSRQSIADGGSEDVRGSFIVPQYAIDEKSGKKTPAFRFIIPEYNAKGDTVNFVYKEFPLDIDKSGNLIKPYQFTETIDGVAMIYQLTHVIDDDYTVNYKNNYDNKTYKYLGEKDYLMRYNRAYPMFYIYKCSLQEGYSQLHSPIVSRLAEMYLNAAEAYIKKGEYPTALTYLNVIRKRASGNGYKALNAQNAKELVTKERQLEFAFEAHRTIDVFRNGETMKRRYPGPHSPMIDYPAKSNRAIQLIPQSEINAYPVTLTQNPI